MDSALDSTLDPPAVGWGGSGSSMVSKTLPGVAELDPDPFLVWFHSRAETWSPEAFLGLKVSKECEEKVLCAFCFILG